MPIFEYICRNCDHHFEAVVQGSQKANCPKCESRRLEQQFSSFRPGGYKGYVYSEGGFGKTGAGSPRCRVTTGRKVG